MERYSDMNIDTILLAEISENIRSLQLQLDYERAKIITALGGEPALYGTGNILHAGTGSAIAGATMQVDGDLVIGDGAGGKIVSVGQSGVVGAKKYTTNNYTITDDTAISFTAPGTVAGMIFFVGNNNGIYGIIHYRVTSGVFCTGVLLSPALAVTTGALSGTTGSDAKITVSAHSDGKIYIENREGVTLTVSVVIMGY
jgi:hypothetical protein